MEDNTINELQIELSRLRSELVKAQDERDLANGRYEKLMTQLNATTDELVACKGELETIKAKLATSLEERHKLKQALDAEQQAISSLRESASWKLTAPLRKLIGH